MSLVNKKGIVVRNIARADAALGAAGYRAVLLDGTNTSVEQTTASLSFMGGRHAVIARR
jgi:hypothetical protein